MRVKTISHFIALFIRILLKWRLGLRDYLLLLLDCSQTLRIDNDNVNIPYLLKIIITKGGFNGNKRHGRRSAHLFINLQKKNIHKHGHVLSSMSI